MLCFSVIARRNLVTAPSYDSPMFDLQESELPVVTEGIVASRRSGSVHLAPDVRVRVSPALLQADPSAGHVKADRDTVLILRASYRRGDDGSIEFVPETKPDEIGALAFLDIGRGSHSDLKYGHDATEILARTRRPAGLILGTEDVALAHLMPYRPVGAFRSTRRWLFLGGDVVRETLYVNFTGQNINLQLLQ